jgi:hypothetical protein
MTKMQNFFQIWPNFFRKIADKPFWDLATVWLDQLTISSYGVCGSDKIIIKFQEKFVESAFLSGLPEKLGGAICMQYNRERGEGHFLWTHTTASMGIGFQVIHNIMNE